MKKYLRPLGAVLALMLLAGVAYAASAGDSLVSLSYFKSTFSPGAVQKGESRAEQLLQDTYDQALDRLKAAASQTGGGTSLSGSTLEPRLWSDGEVISLPTGSGFLLLEGSASVTHSGAVVDVTAGTELASGGRLTAGHRYLVGEDTDASVTVQSGQALMGVQGGYSLSPGLEKHTPFYDISRSVWYYGAVNYVYEQGLFNGVSEHRFSPSSKMNRAMLITVVYRLAGSPAQSTGPAFSDVPDGTFYSTSVAWGAAQGIISGVGNNAFAPLSQVTREQAVAMLYNYTKNYLKKSVGAGADLSGFTDADQVSAWARPSMAWAVEQGIVKGSLNNGVLTLSPRRGTTRAEMASMLQTFCEKIL